jgi:translation elongation factor EF-Tu-like GTPase
MCCHQIQIRAIDFNAGQSYTKTKKRRGGEVMQEEVIGVVTDFYAHPVVAGIQLTATLKVGDKIHIKGHSTDIEVAVHSMQIDRQDVPEAKSGDSIGIKVPDRVRKGDHVYKVVG